MLPGVKAIMHFRLKSSVFLKKKWLYKSLHKSLIKCLLMAFAKPICLKPFCANS